MINFLVIGWVLVGIGSSVCLVHRDLCEGLDYTVSDVGLAIITSIIGGPVVFLYYLETEHNFFDKVILKGKSK